MSSDKLSSIQQPVVSLDLTLATAGRRETENIELSREELATLITSLEAANRVYKHEYLPCTRFTTVYEASMILVALDTFLCVL